MIEEVTARSKTILKWSFIYLGTAILLPWNAVLTTAFDMSSFGIGPSVSNEWNALSTNTYSGISLVTVVILFFIASMIPLKLRLYSSFCMLGATLAVMGIVCQIALRQMVTFIVGLICCGLIGLTGSTAQGSSFGLAGLIGDGTSSVALMIGMGFSGLICLVLQIFLKIANPYNSDMSLDEKSHTFAINFLIYASIGAAFVFGALFILPLVYAQPQTKAALAISMNDDGEDMLNNNNDEQLASQTEQATLEADLLSSSAPARSVFRVALDILPMAFSCFNCMFCTFLCFPLPAVLLKPNGTILSAEDVNVWMPIWIVGSYQVSDLLGRQIVDWGLKANQKWTLIASLGRYINLVLISFCYKATSGFFNDFIVKVLVVFILGLSNGWVSSLSFMHAPSRVKRDSEQGLGGFIMTFCLLGGIAVGSVVASKGVLPVLDSM